MRTHSYDLDAQSSSAIRAALADVPADRQPFDLPRPKPVEQLSRCRLQPAPPNSAKHLAHVKAVRLEGLQQRQGRH